MFEKKSPSSPNVRATEIYQKLGLPIMYGSGIHIGSDWRFPNERRFVLYRYGKHDKREPFITHDKWFQGKFAEAGLTLFPDGSWGFRY